MTHKKRIRAEALRLRSERHMTYSNIARLLDIPRGTARYWCVAALSHTPRGNQLVCTSRVPAAQFLYHEMVHQNYSANQLARRSGVSASFIINFLKGTRTNCSYLLIETLFNTLGFQLEWTPIPKQPSPSNTQPASPSSSNSSQANGQSTTQHAN